ncbi:MAG: EF2563 family selenium-dependent molybdenum hydroxylase system protein [Chloroflexi bacterium]|nr:EF2563 family selenium-dependent molybdenum hydroxylase system protein [Chloroflexota bacterium]
MPLSNTLVLVRGGGDLASGAIYRLHRVGFPIVVAELPRPVAVRRAVSFAEALYNGEMIVEGITARRAADANEARAATARGEVAVMADPDGDCRRLLAPPILIDGRMAKANLGTRIDDAPLVVGLGPGFTAGLDCHAVVETMRGHTLGRVIWQGSAIPNTGVPEGVLGYDRQRVLRAPCDGRLRLRRDIGDRLSEGDAVAEVDGRAVLAPFAGVLRGIARDGLEVAAGMKIGDVDPRGVRGHCFTISDKALAVGGGVLEAVMVWMRSVERES